MVGAGVSGYIPKWAATIDLVTAIRTVHAGQVYVHPSIAQSLAEGLRRRARGNHDKLHSGDLVRYAMDKGLASLDRRSTPG